MKRSFLVLGFAVTIWVTCAVLALYSWNHMQAYKDMEKGKQLVEAMYQFNDLLELDDKQSLVEEMVTEEVFRQIGLDYNDNGLNKYLKLHGGPSFVIFEEVGTGYVIYSLENSNVTESRKFVLFYSLDDAGKIDWVREGELYDFG